jgi:predicted  nucleic acid-binding Zn-ribbon protein
LGPAELLLRYQDLDLRAQALAAEIEQIEGRLRSDSELEDLLAQQEAARSGQQALELRLRDTEREVEGHRVRLRGRQSELMSGRVRNPTELMQMSSEVDHMRDRLRTEEDAELELMEQLEAAESERKRLEEAVAAVRARLEAAAPGLRDRMQVATSELAEVEADRDGVWSEVPADYQHAYRRVRAHPAVAQVVGNACAACHVAVTTSQMQQLRRGDQIVQCDNCGRLLVVA